MKNGYKILWTDNAINELNKTIDYLENNWTDKEIKSLFSKLEWTLKLISENPFLYPSIENQYDIRRAIIHKFNTLYYRINADQIIILSFFSNRQAPETLQYTSIHPMS